jgi:processive 1,2-diacylglycerol beta-glucosyltransferase
MTGEAPILIVSASAGTGHVRAGDALAEAMQREGVRAEHVDVLRLAPRWVKHAYGGGFELLASRAPRLWREVYALADGPDGDSARWGPVAARALFGGFRRLLHAERWRLCLCTHFLPSQLMAGRSGAPPFGLVVTDFALHRYWVQPRVREYFTATRAVAAAVRARLPAARALASGIPIDPAFLHPPAWQDARAALGLAADRPVALVMGGGLGMGLDETVEAALAAPVDGLQIVAVCGWNDDLRRRLESRSHSEDRLCVLGFRRDIPTLFAAADVIVTKPGGLTTSEALALGRPMILTRPIPGHEDANVEHLTRTGAALAAPNGHALVEMLARFFADPALRFRLAEAARGVGAPDAAREIARAVRDHYALRAVA